MIGEGRRECAREVPCYIAIWSSKKAVADGLIGFHWEARAESVRRIVGQVGWYVLLSVTIAVVVMDGNPWPVDGYLLEVRSSVTVQLSVQIRVDSTLEDWVISEINATYDMTGLELLDTSTQDL